MKYARKTIGSAAWLALALPSSAVFAQSETPYNPEAYVRSCILTLVEYINRLQVR